MTVELRAASSLSLGELAALFTRAYEGYVVPMQLDEDAMRFVVELFDINVDAGLIAVDNGEPVGVVNLGLRGDRAWIGGLGVVAAARRRGIGRTLMDAIHGEAARRGVREISLEVIEGNDGAHRLYEDLGYKPTRWLEIGSLDQADGPQQAEEVPWNQAHTYVQERRVAAEPWQRGDQTLQHYDNLRGLRTDTGAAVFRIQSDDRVMPVQYVGDERAALAILTSLRSLGPVSLFNFPEEDALVTAFKELGGDIALRQREMRLSTLGA